MIFLIEAQLILLQLQSHYLISFLFFKIRTDVESGTNQRNSSEYPIETDVEGTSEGDGEKVENDAQLSYYNSNIQKRCREDDKNDTESCKRLRSCDIRQCSSSRQLISPETVGRCTTNSYNNISLINCAGCSFIWLIILLLKLDLPNFISFLQGKLGES